MERPSPAPPRFSDRPPWRAAGIARCANCEIELHLTVVERDGRRYCCEGCAIGGPCVC